MDHSARKVLTQLTAPDHLWSWAELQDHKSKPPAQAGVYAWYFKRKPPSVPGDRCHWVRRMPLLYIGISPARLTSRETIRSRLRYHFGGNASGSTLRTTLGALLQRELDLSFRRISVSTMKFLPDDEARLSDWMADNARVAWAVCDRPWEVEHELVRALSLPLNLANNTEHPFYLALSAVRKVMKDGAASNPIWR